MEKNTSVKVVGEYTDTIRHKNGEIEVLTGKNLVVEGIYKLITSNLSNKNGYSGIQYWAVGTGNASWDTTLPNPLVSDTILTTELARKAVSSTDMVWLDGANNVSPTPTNKLKVKVTFSYNEAVGAWREFGIFGGNATGSANTGILLNHKHHAVINKTNEMEIEREIIFTFSS